MDTVDLVAYNRAVSLGKPFRTASAKRFLIHENALVIAVIGARGERELPMGVAIGGLKAEAPSAIGTYVPGTHDQNSKRTGDSVWDKVGPTLATAAARNDHPQIVVTNMAALKLLEAWAESRHRGQRVEEGRLDNNIIKAAQTLNYCCRRAAVAGSHSAVTISEVLSQHWAFPLPQDATLGTKLRSLGLNALVDGDDLLLDLDHENRLYKDILIVNGVTTKKSEDTEMDSVTDSKKGFTEEIEKLATQAWLRTRAGAELLLGDDRLPLPILRGVCKTETDVWQDHQKRVSGIERAPTRPSATKALSFKLDGTTSSSTKQNKIYAMAERDNEKTAAEGLVEMSESEEAWSTALVAHDTFERSRAVLAGKALSGEIVSCSADKIVVESRQRILSMRLGDELCAIDPGDNKSTCSFVVVELPKATTGSANYVAHLRWKGKLPATGASCILVPKVTKWPELGQIKGMFKCPGWPHKPVGAGNSPPMLPTGETVEPEKPEDAERIVSEAVAKTDGYRLVVVASPPGAGKTTLLSSIASTEVQRGRRVLVAATTNAQCRDLANRIAANGTETWWLVRSGYKPVDADDGVNVCGSTDDVPSGPVASVATVAKLATVAIEKRLAFHVDLLAIDEAWQVTDADFMTISNLAQRYLLIGDPGQIPPVVKADLTSWRAEPDGPHVPCPQALMARWSRAVKLVRLPATRRFPADTAKALAPFYAGNGFGSVNESKAPDFWPFNGKSLVALEVHPRYIGDVDPAMERLTARLVQWMIDKGAPADQVGVVCTYVRQVAGVQAELSALGLPANVETANRWQGLECDFIIAWHPLSGASQVTELTVDAGRLCVSVSRHRRGVIVLMRPGVRELLETGAVTTGRMVPEGLKNYGGRWPYAAKDSAEAVARDPQRLAVLAQRQFLDSLDPEPWDEDRRPGQAACR